MQITHALNLFDSLHTMLDMESSKRFGTVSPDVLFSRTTLARAPRQQSANDSTQIQRCQQQSQQQ